MGFYEAEYGEMKPGYDVYKGERGKRTKWAWEQTLAPA